MITAAPHWLVQLDMSYNALNASLCGDAKCRRAGCLSLQTRGINTPIPESEDSWQLQRKVAQTVYQHVSYEFI